MSNAPDHSSLADPISAMEKRLADAIAEFEATIAGPLRAGIAAMKAARGYIPPISEDSPAGSPSSPKATLSKESVYYGLGLQDAGAKVLSLSENQAPMKPREIAVVLQAAGYETAKEDLAAAVRAALLKRQVDRRDVLPVGGGRWGLREWYTEDQIRQIIASLGEKPTRDAELHSDKTRLGMMIARARGARMGRVPFEEQYVQSGIVAEYRRRREMGMTVEQARKSFKTTHPDIFKHPKSDGIPRSTITKWKHIFEEGLPPSAKEPRASRKPRNVVPLRVAK